MTAFRAVEIPRATSPVAIELVDRLVRTSIEWALAEREHRAAAKAYAKIENLDPTNREWNTTLAKSLHDLGRVILRERSRADDLAERVRVIAWALADEVSPP